MTTGYNALNKLALYCEDFSGSADVLIIIGILKRENNQKKFLEIKIIKIKFFFLKLKYFTLVWLFGLDHFL